MEINFEIEKELEIELEIELERLELDLIKKRFVK